MTSETPPSIWDINYNEVGKKNIFWKPPRLLMGLLEYPMSMIRMKALCYPYIRWSPLYYDFNGELAPCALNLLREESNGILFYKSDNLLIRYWANVLPIRTLIKTNKIYGIPGLFRGFLTCFAHLASRWVISHYLYNKFNYFLSRISSACNWTLYYTGISSLIALPKHKDPKNESTPPKIVGNKVVIKYLTEIITHPLFSISSRQATYLGLDNLGFWETIHLTYTYEGIGGFFKGISFHLAYILISDFVNCFLEKTFLRDDKIAIRNCCGFFLLPLKKISLILRCTSDIEGLCAAKPLSEIVLSVLEMDLPLAVILTTSILLYKAISDY